MSNLRIPGPTPLPPEVMAAVGQQMINHRGPEFEAMFGEISAWLKVFFETEQDVYVLTSSGTGAMEAAIVNTLSPGDRVLAVTIGVFGDRFAEIAKAYGADVTTLKLSVGPGGGSRTMVAATIRRQGAVQGGAVHPERDLDRRDERRGGAIARPFTPPLIRAADPGGCISGLGAIRLQMDAWGVDVLVSGSQKAWMAPPGLAMIALSQRAWEAYETRQNARASTLTWARPKSTPPRNQTPATPNVAALYGLHVSLKQDDGRGR